ncbi:uncharacterized protein F4807DRAFT_211424 [Annulohypoxylon truncatum]|uniref:uncharacterized protein n=1 Tax=Annulohypoxylon truncatum TaxID=327061 RepID=UPI00200823C6|nr:uncharacterized protein F4807DRAFT_211424 [Annulohypoxylon truncatum]KAI1207023.1 hypothetical protein F4807DRAFT_211424 [Annulohypoxylon truncatum]
MSSVQIQPHGNENATMGISALAVVLAVISVALRFYTRIFTRAGLKADDWLIMLAVIATLISAVLLLWANAVSPVGLWVSENTNPDYVYTPGDILYLKLAFITSIFYFTISGATKLGILIMYYRIFALSTAFRYMICFASGLIVGWWVGCTVATLTNCIPLEWSWLNSLSDPRYCLNYNIFWMASGSCEIFLDVLILTLPITVVTRMRLSLEQKLTVSGIFLLGGFVIITGLVRVILGYPPGRRVPSYSNTEVWTSVHAGMSIVCASLPILKPLVRRISGSRSMTKISSILSLRRNGDSLRWNPNRGTPDSSRCDSSGEPENNDLMKISPLVTIGGTPMPESHFYQPRVAYSGIKAARSTTQQELNSEIGAEEREGGMFLQLPQIEISEGIKLPFQHTSP